MAIAWAALEHSKGTSVKLVLRRSVPLAIRGHVADARGAPIAGARIVFGRDEMQSATSDESGGYALRPAPCGELLAFHVIAGGFGRIDQDLHDSELGDRIVPIRGDDGAVEREELVVDFKLERASTIAGRCVDAAGNGVAGVNVSAQSYDEAHGSQMYRQAASGPDGTFTLVETTPGDWWVEFLPPDPFRQVAPRTIASGTQDVEVRLLAPVVGHARLVVEVVDADSKLPAEVVRASAGLVYGSGWNGKACAFAVGSVTAEGLIVGAWRLEIEGVDRRVAIREFEVTDADTEILLRVELGRKASFDGRVAFADGRPLPTDERLMVWLRAAPNHTNDCGHAVDREGRKITDVTDACANVDADGTFRIQGVTPGVAIRANIDGSSASGESVIVLGPGEHGHVDLVLVPGAKITFRMSEELPPGFTTLELAREGGRFALLAQRNALRRGDDVIQEFVAPGKARWRATYVSEEDEVPDPHTVEGELDVVAGQPQTVEIRGLK
jgi:hypothetical protein